MSETYDPNDAYGAVSAYVWCVSDRWLVVAQTKADAVRLAWVHGWVLPHQPLTSLDMPNVRRATQHEVDTLGDSLQRALG